ncbi:succinate-semialdehyde dehydrogenase/glutarate-semialdehyde dehydrogenase [Luteibacter sp. 621]|uniref:NAD-dependent succinate-semialdehyde dehydrogenase n=1 Tax=Luteibacter sp. 621 TaxID=3373916 RepID=UPI003D254F26
MTYQTINPYTGKLVQTFAEHTDSDIERILASAHAAHATWSARDVETRSAVLRRAAALLRTRAHTLAELLTLEMGKLTKDGLGEVELSAAILEYYADNAAAFLADRTLTVASGPARVVTESLGVIFCIEPWNFPYYQLARVTGPNLAVGNTLVAKHAPNVPQCALAFEQVMHDGGAHGGVYTNVFISNEQAATVIADKRVRGVALTGSERAGAAVAAEAGHALKKSTMELGGSDAFIVLDDANLDEAARIGAASRLHNAGQVCNAAKRFIVEERVADEFIRKFTEAMAAVQPGDPAKPATTLQPLNSAPALENALAQVRSAVDAGARLVLGGSRTGMQGFFMEPTILTDVSPENPAYHQEFFAPVAMVFRVSDEEAAVSLANDSPFGLGAMVMSGDIERANRVAARLETGMVFINRGGFSAPDLPFGGVKNSGYGRELADLGFGEFVNKKLIHA